MTGLLLVLALSVLLFLAVAAELAKQKQTMRTDSIGQDPEQIGLKSSPETHSV